MNDNKFDDEIDRIKISKNDIEIKKNYIKIHPTMSINQSAEQLSRQVLGDYDFRNLLLDKYLKYPELLTKIIHGPDKLIEEFEILKIKADMVPEYSKRLRKYEPSVYRTNFTIND